MDYSALLGGLELTQSVVDQLSKALEIGYENPPVGGADNGSPYRVQSLDRTLYSALFGEQHAPFFAEIAKKPARTILEEYNVLLSYGDEAATGWVAEIDLPNESATDVRRKTNRVKYLAQRGRVSFVAGVIETAHGDPIAIETANKTKLMISEMERTLFYGDSTIAPYEFDGLQKSIVDDFPGNVIDVRGQFNIDVVMDAATKIAERPNFGQANRAWLPARVFSDYSKGVMARLRAQAGSKDIFVDGAAVRNVTTTFGEVELTPDIFLNDGRGAPDGQINAVALGKLGERPGNPVVSTALAAAGTGSSFVTPYVGAYAYWAVAVNRKGRSAPVSVGSVTPTSGQNITFGLLPDVGSPLPSHYDIYRTTTAGATATRRRIARVAVAASAPATTAITVTDTNAILPGSSDVFVTSFNPTAIMLMELLGMVRIPMGVTDLSQQWMQLYMSCMRVPKPAHHLVLRNILPAAGSLLT